MFSVFANAWKVPDLRKKLLYVLLILVIYRIGCHIPLPLIDVQALLDYQSGMGSADSLYAFLVGGGMGTIMAMGIGPYITSSIIMQLLTVAIPKLEQLQKEGEEGRKKINQYTRILAVALAFLQGGGTVYTLHQLFIYQNFLVYAMATVAIVTGTIFIMWLAELLTERGIGNGSSFIIFANILSGLPGGVLDRAKEILGALSAADIAGSGDSEDSAEQSVVYYGRKKKFEAANRLVIKEILEIDTGKMNVREVLRRVDKIQGRLRGNAAAE